jgi:ankyrin repeat protein
VGTWRWWYWGSFISQLLCLHAVPTKQLEIFYTLHLQNEQTPLHCAAEWGHQEVVALLLDRGANVDATDEVSMVHPCYECRVRTWSPHWIQQDSGKRGSQVVWTWMTALTAVNQNMSEECNTPLGRKCRSV